MRERTPLLGLLGSASVFLVSLYLPWRSAPRGAALNGWASVDGYAAALLALALVACSAAALLRPPLAGRLPLGGLGAGLAYFASAVAVQVDAVFAEPPPGTPGWAAVGLHYGWTYGLYVGVGSGAVAGVAALVLRRPELLRRRAPSDAAAAMLGLGLLASFLLPWAAASGSVWEEIGLSTSPGTIAAVGILLGAGRLPAAGAPLRLGGAVAAAMLTGAAASGFQFSAAHRYGTWVGVGCAVALVALEALRARRSPLPAVPARVPALRAGAAVLLLVALFLPAQEYRLPDVHILVSGWQTTSGAAAGVLALLLLFALLLPRLESYALDATLGVVLLVATLGIYVAAAPLPVLRLGYGAYVEFASAACLLLLALPRLRPARRARRSALVWALPPAASVACLTAILLPLWYVLPERWMLEATAVQSWFSMAGLLLALYLVRVWLLRLGGASTAPHRLTLVPLVLLPLPALQLLRYRDVTIVWGGVILVALCLLLAVLGWIEESGGGLERLRVPEFLRLDRLPEAQG